jgi:uncharacterized protein (TIGR02118 family)
MIKTIALIKRLPTLDRETFRTHYETRHSPLALPLMEGLERYVRYHVERDLHGEVGFDVVTAFWYRDQPSIDRIFERLQGDEGAEIRADELRFMDKKANRFFAVSERLLESGEEGDEHVFVILNRPDGMSRFECSKRIVRDHWPGLQAALPGPGFALLRDAFGIAGAEPACDAVLQVQAIGETAIGGWARTLEAEGYRIRAVRTRRFETPLG